MLLLMWTGKLFANDTTEIRQHILEIATKISKNNTLDNKAVGFAGSRTDQYQRFDFLVQQATDNELITFTNHVDPKVRVYAFWALAKRKNKNIRSIMEEHLNDTALFSYFSGCMKTPKQVNYFFIEVLTPGDVDPFCIKLTSQDVNYYRQKIALALQAKN